MIFILRNLAELIIFELFSQGGVNNEWSRRYAPSGVKTPDQQTVQICINGKTLHIPECSDNRISVFTPEGILLKDTDISCGGCQISLPSSGIYIISNGSYRIKIKL